MLEITFLFHIVEVVDAVNSGVPDWSRKGHLINDIRANLQEMENLIC